MVVCPSRPSQGMGWGVGGGLFTFSHSDIAVLCISLLWGFDILPRKIKHVHVVHSLGFRHSVESVFASEYGIVTW